MKTKIISLIEEKMEENNPSGPHDAYTQGRYDILEELLEEIQSLLPLL